jgi:signal transduction histidine kinase
MSSNQVQVLVVEDDPVDQMAFQRLVKQENLPYDYVIADSTQAAREILSKQPFDIVLLDYYLGDGTGFDLIDFIGDKPLIFISGSEDTDSAVRAMKAGAYDYVIKDIHREYLKILPITIDNALKRWRTEQQVMEMAQERAQRETLALFIRDASHDLRTPLAALGLSVDVLDRYSDQLLELTRQAPSQQAMQGQAQKIKNRARQIRQQHYHLGEIILTMLEMVRLDSLAALELNIADLNMLTSQVVEGPGDRARQKSQQLHFEPALEPALAAVNKEEFRAIIINLVDNALNFTPDGGIITIRIQSEPERVALVVEDNGIGIPAEEIPLIFKRFYRVNKARTMASESGSGLGLAIVKRLVELHHGSIEVESVLGKGSLFRVILPRQKS